MYLCLYFLFRGYLGSWNIIELLKIRGTLECVRTRGKNKNEIVKTVENMVGLKTVGIE